MGENTAAVRSSRDVLLHLSRCFRSDRVSLLWDAAFSRKNKKTISAFFSSIATTTDAPFPFVFLFPLFVKKYFLKTEGCHEATVFAIWNMVFKKNSTIIIQEGQQTAFHLHLKVEVIMIQSQCEVLIILLQAQRNNKV